MLKEHVTKEGIVVLREEQPERKPLPKDRETARELTEKEVALYASKVDLCSPATKALMMQLVQECVRRGGQRVLGLPGVINDLQEKIAVRLEEEADIGFEQWC